MAPEKITSRRNDFFDWYNPLVTAAEPADYTCVQGCINLRPDGWALWENLQDALDQCFKDTGHGNAILPHFIPMAFIDKDREHAEGFFS